MIPITTFIGTNTYKKSIYTDDDMKHMFVCGTTGSGKTVALSNYIKSAIDKDYPALIVDGKGDIGKGSILDIVYQLNNNRKKVYCINLLNPETSDKYNAFKNANATIAKDMLVNMSEWSEEHYKSNTERFLQRLIRLLVMNDIPLSFETIVPYITSDKFIELSVKSVKERLITKEEHLHNCEIAQASGEISENASARFANIIESDIGSIFDISGIDIYTALKENAIIIFILNPLLYPEVSPLLGRLILIDAKKAVSNLFTTNEKRIFFIFDEINVYASSTLIDLINKSRSANITCILAAQSLSDLELKEVGEKFKQQVIENCNNYIVMRQNSAKNAEEWAKIIGTKPTVQVTYKISQYDSNFDNSGYGSARKTREFIYHPDDIKALPTGKAFFISKDIAKHEKVLINKPF